MLEDQLDPRDRAEADTEQAASESADAALLTHTAASLNQTMDNLRLMGFDEAGNALGREATREIVEAAHDVQQAQHFTAAADAWTTAADDLDQSAKARGQAWVAAAGHREVDEMLLGPLSEADRTHAEVAAGAAASMETTLGHRADVLGHDAELAARTALDEEEKARGH